MTIKGKALGIDYGDRRIGIAVSDIGQDVVFVRDYVENTSRPEVIQKIKDLCDQDQISLVVVGLPLNMEGNDTDQTRKVRLFVEDLKQAIGMEIVLHDERLTAVRSGVILTSIGVKGEDRKERKDAIEASLILQNYLDLLGKSQGNKKGDNHIQ
ncbi:Holliday junction resolvase RuvX [bacterium]|nr:Holliday junction resolvase RuvX [bacterium]